MSLSGSICAIATPFRSRDDAIDATALCRLIDHLIDQGTSAIVLGGSTGEAAMLDEAEFDQLLELGLRQVAGRVPTLAGTGLSGTRRTIVQTQRARARCVCTIVRRVPDRPVPAKVGTRPATWRKPSSSNWSNSASSSIAASPVEPPSTMALVP